MRTNTQKFWICFAVVVAVIVLFMLCILTTVQIFKIKSLQRKEKKLQAKLDSLLQTEAYYDNANAYASSQEFIEKYAREVLNLGKEGEESFSTQEG